MPYRQGADASPPQVRLLICPTNSSPNLSDPLRIFDRHANYNNANQTNGPHSTTDTAVSQQASQTAMQPASAGHVNELCHVASDQTDHRNLLNTACQSLL